MKTGKLIALSILAMLLSGCLVKDLKTPHPSLTVRDITVPSDTVAGLVIYRVPVTSNESWNVLPDPSRTWASVYMGECLNTSGVEQTSYVEIICENNESNSPRTATFDVVSVSDRRTFTVTQRGKVNRVSVDGPMVYEVDASSTKNISIAVKSNTDWTAERADSSSMKFKLSPDAGSGDGMLEITPVENFAADTVKYGYVNLLADGVDPVTVTIVQKTNEPMLFAEVADRNVVCFPEATNGELVFSSNLEWVAEIVDSNIDGLKLNETEGKYGKLQKLGFSMNANTTDATHSATVRISLKAYPEKNISLGISHLAGFSLKVDLKHVGDAAACPLQPSCPEDAAIPLSSDTAINNSQGRANVYNYYDETLDRQFTFEIKTSSYYIAKSSTSSKFVTNKGYMKLPAVEGHRLAYVGFTSVGTNKQYSVSSDDEGTYSVGAKRTFIKDAFDGWNLEETEQNTSYYLYYWSNSCQHNDLVLVYVK